MGCLLTFQVVSGGGENFCSEAESWIASGWLIKHDMSVHGEPAAVLQLLAVLQPHRSSTPVRSVLDYRALNELINPIQGRLSWSSGGQGGGGGGTKCPLVKTLFPFSESTQVKFF